MENIQSSAGLDFIILKYTYWKSLIKLSCYSVCDVAVITSFTTASQLCVPTAEGGNVMFIFSINSLMAKSSFVYCIVCMELLLPFSDIANDYDNDDDF